MGFDMFVGKYANYTSNYNPGHMWKVLLKPTTIHLDIETWFIKKKNYVRLHLTLLILGIRTLTLRVKEFT